MVEKSVLMGSSGTPEEECPGKAVGGRDEAAYQVPLIREKEELATEHKASVKTPMEGVRATQCRDLSASRTHPEIPIHPQHPCYSLHHTLSQGPTNATQHASAYGTIVITIVTGELTGTCPTTWSGQLRSLAKHLCMF